MSQRGEAFEDGNIRTDDKRNQPRNATSLVASLVASVAAWLQVFRLHVLHVQELPNVLTNDSPVRDDGLCQHNTFAPEPGCEGCKHRHGRPVNRLITEAHNALMEKLSQEGRSGATARDQALVDRILVNIDPCDRITLCEIHVLHRVAMGLPEDATVDQFQKRFHDLTRLGHSREWFTYCDFFARLVTFDAFLLQDLYLHPVDLADSGLYHTGTFDEAQCFHCGGRLRCWKPGDDPYKEHARRYPHCEYINSKLTNDPSVCDDGLCQHNTFAPEPGCENCERRCGQLPQRRITVFHNALMEKLSQEGKSGATGKDRSLVDRMLVNIDPSDRIAKCERHVLHYVAMGLPADVAVDQFKKRFHDVTRLGYTKEWFTNPVERNRSHVDDRSP